MGWNWLVLGWYLRASDCDFTLLVFDTHSLAWFPDLTILMAFRKLVKLGSSLSTVSGEYST